MNNYAYCVYHKKFCDKEYVKRKCYFGCKKCKHLFILKEDKKVNDNITKSDKGA